MTPEQRWAENEAKRAEEKMKNDELTVCLSNGETFYVKCDNDPQEYFINEIKNTIKTN